MIFRMRTRRILRHMLLAFTIFTCALITAAAMACIGFDLAYADRVFRGVSVGGICIGGMSQHEAAERLRAELDITTLNSDLLLEYDGHTWPLPLYEIDAYVDIETTVKKALGLGKDIPFYERWAKRAAFRGLDRDAGLVIHYDRRSLQSFLRSLESTVNRPVVNAEIRLEGRNLVFQRSQEGWKLDSEHARSSILAALYSLDRVAKLTVEVTMPEVSDENAGKAITVDKRNHILTLYNNMEIEKQYPVAVGKPSWPTPSGTYHVTSKQRNPAWGNPGSSWAANMPRYIPPGPGNPLGTRAIRISASGIAIHGTYKPWSIGTSASHGCIRMHIRDSEDLFERVPIGIRVLIF